MMTKPTKATITFDNNAKPIELPVLSGTAGFDVIDIRNLGKHGVYTYDPGFMATAACQSNITYIDGEKGVLLHRGYPIEQLAEHCNFLEVSYLLMHGELPNAAQSAEFTHIISSHTMLHDQLSNIFRGFRQIGRAHV